jgi:hypothetical protein
MVNSFERFLNAEFIDLPVDEPAWHASSRNAVDRANMAAHHVIPMLKPGADRKRPSTPFTNPGTVSGASRRW